MGRSLVLDITALRAPSDGSVQPIAEIPESGHDIFLTVERPIDHWGENLDAGMALFDQRDAFRRSDDAHDADRARTGARQQIEGGDRAAAGGEHRIDHYHVAAVEQ